MSGGNDGPWPSIAEQEDDDREDAKRRAAAREFDLGFAEYERELERRNGVADVSDGNVLDPAEQEAHTFARGDRVEGKPGTGTVVEPTNRAGNVGVYWDSHRLNVVEWPQSSLLRRASSDAEAQSTNQQDGRDAQRWIGVPDRVAQLERFMVCSRLGCQEAVPLTQQRERDCPACGSAMMLAGKHLRIMLVERAEPTSGPEIRERAEQLLREHWVSIGCDPDTMATLDTLGEGERETWLERAADPNQQSEGPDLNRIIGGQDSPPDLQAS